VISHTTYLSLLSEVAEALGQREVGDTEAASVQGVGQRLGRIGVLDISPDHGGVDGREDTPKLRSSWKSSIAADGRDDIGKWVGVLLGSDEGGSAGNDLGVVAQRRNNLIRKLKLQASG
jgi:hypothetical protein